MTKMRFDLDLGKLSEDQPFSSLKCFLFIVNSLWEYGFVLDETDRGVYIYDGTYDIDYILPRLTTDLERWEGLFDCLANWYGSYDGIYADFLQSYRNARTCA